MRANRLIVLLALLIMLGIVGCDASSHRISTVNRKTSASFKNKKVSAVIDVLVTSFGPMKGFKAEIPRELRDVKISFEFSDVSSIEPVRKALADATGYTVEVDAPKRHIRFVKK